jgi:hypothetical protein
LVLSVSQISEEQLLYSPGHFQTIAKMQYFLNTSPGLTVPFLGGEHRDFLEEGVETYQMAPKSPLNSTTFFLSAYL